MGFKVVALLLLLVVVSSAAAVSGGGVVTYDGRALIVNGTRRMLFSGSIHYLRSTPQMWPSLIAQAKKGGLDVIQTYVFWGAHEPIKGQYNFQGRLDLVRFIKEIRDQGLYVSLRVGPYVESEWKYGGLPVWLRDVPGIVFRSDNEPFKIYMQKFVTMIVNLMKSEGLYSSQGGPIIISQIENEYQTVESKFRDKGPSYVEWAASMAVGLQTGVPWMMCKQADAPDPVINTCNGRRCGETFIGPNSFNKPSLWTESWTSWYLVYGGEPYISPANEIAFAVALFIAAKKGSFVNYYMYHGGTNFGRSTSSYVATSYYDEAPLDEYGLIRQPKWGHLRELHAAIKLSSEPLLLGTYSNFSLGQHQEAHIFQMNSGKCATFLVNLDRFDTAVQFRNIQYELPQKSISILPDCKHVVFNTARVNAQYGIRSTTTVQNFDAASWGVFRDLISNIDSSSFIINRLLEQIKTTKDLTDYLWYTVSYGHTSSDNQNILHVGSRAHVIHAFVNGAFVGSAFGKYGKRENIVLRTPISLKNGHNNISLLSAMVGLPDSGAYLESKIFGIRNVRIQDSSNNYQDLSKSLWGYQVGLRGEKLNIFTELGSTKVIWANIGSLTNQPLAWYKTTFNAPSGTDPVVVNLGSMGKGEVWVNGESIGRYWVSNKTPKGQPSQSRYHIPRSFLKPLRNFLVLFEEIGGDPLQITLEAVSVPRVCGMTSTSHHPPLLTRKKRPSVQLQCDKGRTITSIEFASYGKPIGDCEKYELGSCHSPASKTVVNKACLGRKSCAVPLLPAKFGEDPCPGTLKSLLVVANCS